MSESAPPFVPAEQPPELPVVEPIELPHSPAPAAAVPPPLPLLSRQAARRQQVEKEFREVQRVCWFYGALLVPILATAGWAHHSGETGLTPELWGGAAFYGTILVFAWLWRDEWRELLRWPAQLTRSLAAMIVLTPIATIAAAVLLLAGAEKIGLPVRHATPLMVEAGWPVWLQYGWVAILPPLFEEVAFRGLILAKLRRITDVNQAIWMSALLFGLAHFNLLGIAVFLVPLGLAAAYLTYRTRSLLPALLIHAVHNAGVVTLELLTDVPLLPSG